MQSLQTSCTIDWLAYTVTEAYPPRGEEATEAGAEVFARRVTGCSERFRPCKPLHGYRMALEAEMRPGLRVLLAGSTKGMGTHVQWSGSALVGENLPARLQYAVFAAGRITRLDLALDVRARIAFRALYDAARDGRLDTRARRAGILESETGTTVYIGSRTSEQFLRVYDKAAQVGAALPWTRIELECKGRTASAIAHYLAEGDLRDIPRVIRAFCDWPGNELWTLIMNDIPKVAVPKAEKVTDRERWIREQVRPALRTALRENSLAAREVVTDLLRDWWELDANEVVRYSSNRGRESELERLADAIQSDS